MSKIIKKFIGDRAFYRRTLSIAVPIMIQNGITNFVSLLDNIMVGRVGTEQMSAVAIVNQLIMIYNLCIFGAAAGAGIFTTQYFGEGNDEGIKHTVRFKIWICGILTVLAAAVFMIFSDPLISAYLRGNSDGGDMSAALMYGKSYLKIMMFGFVPFAVLQVYSGTLRECNETVVPMKAGIVAVFVNLSLNYLLIYGKLGFPELGVAGAALATVIARYVEAAIVIIWTHTHKHIHTYINGLYKTLRVPFNLLRGFTSKSLPLLANESLWSGGMAMLSQRYCIRGLSVIAGLNIANTVYNVFSVVFIALGEAVAIIVGQLLGAGEMEKAKDTDNKLIAFSVISCMLVAIFLLLLAPVFPKVYNTTDIAKNVATQFIIAQALFMPQTAFINATYFTLRSGGKTTITFVFDSLYVWCVSVPVAYLLSRFTLIPAVYIFVLVNIADWIKCIIGFILVKRGNWIQNIVRN